MVDECKADTNEPQASEKGYTSLEAACYASAVSGRSLNLAATQFLLQRGAKVTPYTLHIAAAYGHLHLCRLLLQHGARVEECFDGPRYRKDKDYRKFGSTVVDTARLNEHYGVVEMLEAYQDPRQEAEGQSTEASPP